MTPLVQSQVRYERLQNKKGKKSNNAEYTAQKYLFYFSPDSFANIGAVDQNGFYNVCFSNHKNTLAQCKNKIGEMMWVDPSCEGKPR